ncbi:KRI1-like family C-terminal-domain-containing protein [Stachybotrys elegans]|uniref:KRI1-like family C-terminal-domain-containing protein n=1 Tax=Stachybotrys elegans TaxID=80388 RepID=A0A8K0WPK2_9HYPO|nr:KRI1-like family C-terminal-domain-containing protein [Stachybotrys elegans]
MAPSSEKLARPSETSVQQKNNKRKLLDDSDSDSDDGGAPVLEGGDFKVNKEYAARFEYNKKRQELQKLEEKYGNDDEESSSSSDETEDEDGFLATEDLDVQISATLQAIRNKDPRVYDKNVNFFQPGNDGADAAAKKEKKEKPVFLRDYQREKLLRGDTGASDNEEEAPQTYAQEQDSLKRSIVSEINAAGNPDSSDDDEDDDGFMKRKTKEKPDANGVHPARSAALKITELDVANASKNPENFLSNFMASRAWLPEGGSRWEAFESDEGEDDDKADEWEQAYNLRFEDPEKSNEYLKSYARDVAAARSVRREDKTGRKKRREQEREEREAKKKEKHEEKARLRKLRLEEAEKKLQKIKKTAGATGVKLTDEDWIKFLDEAWEDDKWEEEMQRRFGDEYYAVDEAAAGSEGEEGDSTSAKKKKKIKKPKWDDDIDIKDIVPDFVDDEAAPAITLSDTEAQDAGEGEEEEDEDEDEDEDDGQPATKKRKTADHKRAQKEAQRKARQERSKLEALVDAKLELTDHELLRRNASTPGHAPFRYRETSPQSFGMTARDILLAPSDKVLNDFAGLKKFAHHRAPEKKARDRKRLGKKARLRQWRREVFGREFEHSGPTYGFERVIDEDVDMDAPPAKIIAPDAGEGGNVVGDVGGRKKKKRSKGKKKAAAAEDS